MVWIFLAIIAHFFWAASNVGDKYVLVNRVKNPFVWISWIWLLSPFLLLLVPFINFYVPETRLFIWLIIAGAVAFLSSLLYIKAMQMEEVSRLNMWWNMIPVFTLFIAWFTIGQKLNAPQLVALLILITGAALASIHARHGKVALSKAVLWLGLSCLSYSIYAVIFSYISRFVPFIISFIWVNLVGFACVWFMFLSRSFRQEFKREIKGLNRNLFSILFSISMVEHVAQFFNVWALSLGIAALIFAMEGFQAIFVFIFAIIISLLKPKLLQEELDERNIILKLIALVLMVAGVAVLNLG